MILKRHSEFISESQIDKKTYNNENLISLTHEFHFKILIWMSKQVQVVEN